MGKIKREGEQNSVSSLLPRVLKPSKESPAFLDFAKALVNYDGGIPPYEPKVYTPTSEIPVTPKVKRPTEVVVYQDGSTLIINPGEGTVTTIKVDGTETTKPVGYSAI